MLRRGNRARHYAWTGEHREAVVMEMVPESESEEGSEESTQISEVESEVDHLAILPAVVDSDAVPDTVPVTGESFCLCDPQEEPSPGALLQGLQPLSHCLCGEEDQGFDWAWDEGGRSPGAVLSCDDRKVSFHAEYSCGTAAVRGTKALAEGQHFWEIKMTSPVYGTDMMVGIGTAEVNLEKYRHSFCSMLGSDEDSWGLSYTGQLQHKGSKVAFSSRFSQGSIIGLHLDTWHGTLTFYKNRRRIGVAASRLQNKKLFPMVCSTAAKSSMKVIRACYTPTSLQYLCCTRLRRHLPACPDPLTALPLPPGLRSLLHTQLGWVFSLNNQASEGLEQPGDFPTEPSPAPSLCAPVSPSPSPSPCPCSSLLSNLSACSSSPCSCPPTPPGRSCPCPPTLQDSSCPPTTPDSDSDGSSSDSEDYQRKRCRWT